MGKEITMTTHSNLVLPWIPSFTTQHTILCVNFLLLFVLPVISRTDRQTDVTGTTLPVTERPGAHHKEGRGKMRDSVHEIKALVEALQRQVNSLKKSQARDRSHIRSLEQRLSTTTTEVKSMEEDVTMVIGKVTDADRNMKRIQDRQKDYSRTIEDIHDTKNKFRHNLDEVHEFHKTINHTVHRLDARVSNLDDKEREMEDTITSVIQETSQLRALQLKQKTGLKHVKLELAGFIQEFLPEDDDEEDEDEGDESYDDEEVLDDIDDKEKKSPANKMHLDDSLHLSSATQSFENSAQLPSDTILEGSGNIENVMPTKTIKLVASPISESQGPKNQNNHSGAHRQNDKKLKKEMKIMKESLTEKDVQMEQMQNKVLNLSLELAKLENRVLSLHKDGEILKTQQMAANFTQYLIALDQWRVSSPLIINTTQENQEQVDVLGELILNNTNRLGKLEVKLIDHKYLMEHNEHGIQRELQRMNETLKKVRHRTHHHDHAMTEELAEQFDNLNAQLEQLGTRLMNVEVKVLNTSLNTCSKQQSDFYQDLKLKEMNKKLDKLQENVLLHRETLTRMDRGLYRLHLDIKSHKESIDNLKKESKKMSSYKPEFKAMQEEVTKFLHHLPRDCNEVFMLGQRESGEYIIHPEGSPKSVRVFCDLYKHGGWTVIQRRVDGSEHFSRPWAEYKEGFGTISHEFWLGNEYIYLLTNQKNCSLLIEMYDTFGQKWVAEYDIFRMNDEGNKYSLFLDGYHGNATDSLGDANGMAFSTEDRDQDASSTHCALYYTAGWWYKHCHYCNLNGRYNVGIVWFNQEVNEWLQMNKTVMKIISH